MKREGEGQGGAREERDVGAVDDAALALANPKRLQFGGQNLLKSHPGPVRPGQEVTSFAKGQKPRHEADLEVLEGLRRAQGLRGDGLDDRDGVVDPVAELGHEQPELGFRLPPLGLFPGFGEGAGHGRRQADEALLEHVVGGAPFERLDGDLFAERARSRSNEGSACGASRIVRSRLTISRR